MSNVLPLDAAAALDIDLAGVSLIEASAGTGKTYTLANLYLRQLLAGYPPAQILVVSFTRAATDELLQRIQSRVRACFHLFNTPAQVDDEFLQALLDWHRQQDEPSRNDHRHRLRHALRCMDEAAISTIHGFCQSALQDHALLCGRPFQSDVIANDDAYWEHALRDWWRRQCYPLTQEQWRVFNAAIPSLQGLIGWQRERRRHIRGRVLPESDETLAELLDANPPDSDLDPDSAFMDRVRGRAMHEAFVQACRQVARSKRASGEMAFQDQLDELLAALEGKLGEALAQGLRERFPAAMIDEFQDTDETQFRIFERLYFDRPDCSLVLIGDPKQAIYSFRGSDIFSYMRARRAPGLQIRSLQTNWRSTPALIDAVNQVFSHRGEAFVYADDILFDPAVPAPRDQPRLEVGAGEARAMTLWRIPRQDNGKVFPLKVMRPWLCRTVAAEIGRLLDPDSESRFDGRALRPGDIAILVRRRDEGDEIREALARIGIKSVTIGRNSVLRSDEARGLLDLLEAVAHPGDASRLRRARASNLFRLGYAELDTELNRDDNWQLWVDRLQALHRRWLNSGFIAMFQQLHETLALGPELAGMERAERRLTNLGQLGEILQQQSRRLPGVDALIAWYRHQIEHDNDEANELRLESDGDLVKIITIHKSKGLEYPIVFLPFPWLCHRATFRAQWLRFHVDGEPQFSIARQDFEAQARFAEKERLAEDLRLLYVSLTRAQAKLYLAWGDAGSGNAAGLATHSALGWLLHSTQTPEDLERELPQAFTRGADLGPALDALANRCAGIEIIELPQAPDTGPAPTAIASTMPLPARSYEPSSRPAWRIGSFSSLTRDIHQVALPGSAVAGGDPILDFPAGSHIGLLMHELLEHLDFESQADAAALIAARAPAYGLLRAEQHQVLGDWLRAIIATDLDGDGLRLSALSKSQRLNELQFDFAFDCFDVTAVNQWLQASCPYPLQPVSAADFRGLLTGIIDLVFEFRGKYYFADYKSNHLGRSLEDYRPERLARTMLDRRYDLQSWLYTIALHRYLQHRLPAYSYGEHFGGCYYLFLRAMRPQSGPGYGISFRRPELGQLEELEGLLEYSSSAETGA